MGSKEDLEFFLGCIQAQIDADRKYCEENGFKFEPRRPERGWVRDFILAVLAVKDEESARRFYQGYLECLRADGNTLSSAIDIANSNIGWCFGEGMPEEQIQMWRRICDASHPVFGITIPTPEQAFQLGKEWGKGG